MAQTLKLLGSGFSDDEIRAMASVLRRRHGAAAAAAAVSFTLEHEAAGDLDRANAWRRVQARLQGPSGIPTES